MDIMILLLISTEATKYCNRIAQRSGASQLVPALAINYAIFPAIEYFANTKYP